MVAVTAACADGDDRPPAYAAGKAFGTGMGFIITLFIHFSFVFSVHGLFVLCYKMMVSLLGQQKMARDDGPLNCSAG